MINFVIKIEEKNNLEAKLEEIAMLGMSGEEYRCIAISKEKIELNNLANVIVLNELKDIFSENVCIGDDELIILMEDEEIIFNKEILDKIQTYSKISDMVLTSYSGAEKQDEIYTTMNSDKLVFDFQTGVVFKFNVLKGKQQFFNDGCTIRELRTIVADLLSKEKDYIPLVNIQKKGKVKTSQYKGISYYLENFEMICKEWITLVNDSGKKFSLYEQKYLMRMVVRRFHANKNKNIACEELTDVVQRKKFFKLVGNLLKWVDNDIMYDFLHEPYDAISKQELSVLYTIKNGSLSPDARFRLIKLPTSFVLMCEGRTVGSIDQEVVQMDGAYWNEEAQCIQIYASTNGIFEVFGGCVSAEISGINLPVEISDGANVTYFKKKTSTRKKYCFNVFLNEFNLSDVDSNIQISFFMNLMGKKYVLRCLMKYYRENGLPACAKANVFEIKCKNTLKVIQANDDIAKLQETMDSLMKANEIEGTIVLLSSGCVDKQSIEEFVKEYNKIYGLKIQLSDDKRIYDVLADKKFGFEYIIIMQDGDIISENYLQRTIAFMSKNGLNISMPHDVVQEMKIPDNKERIIDVSNELEIFEDAGIVYKMDAFLKLKEEWINYFFSLKYSSESRLAYLLCLLEYEKKIGILENSIYITSMSTEKDGALFTTRTESDYYIQSAEEFMYKVCEFYKYKLPYCVQVNLFYRLNFRFSFNENQKLTHAIPDEKLEQWYDIAHNILMCISEEVITGFYSIKPAKVKPHVKLFYLWLKDREKYQCSLLQNGKQISFLANDYEIVTTKNERVNIELINYKNNQFVIDVTTRGFFELLNLKPKAEYNDCPIEVEEVYYFAHRKFFGQAFWKRFTFRIVLNIPEDEVGILKFYYEYEGKRYNIRMSSSHYTARISSNVPASYWNCGDFLVSYAKNQSGIVFEPYSEQKQAIMEQEFEKKCLSETSTKLKEYAERGIEIRKKYFQTKNQYKDKHIWLTYDKLYKGGDCGEYMYKFLADNIENIDARYVVNEDAPDYNRLVKEGYPVLKYGSDEHLLDYLHSEVVFNTHGGIHAFNGFDNNLVQFVADLICHDAFTIQHGLTVQELAFNAHRRFNNIRGYFCASKYEIENLSRPIYGYEDKSILKLTGIPRYDGLISDDKRQILITPTWRNYIAMPATAKNEQKGYYEGFKKTDYFKIYNKLLSDDRLIDTARKTGYKLIYLLHPVVSAQISDYEMREGVEIIQASTVNYEQILKESSLMVTDYSGVQFDFAYMRKPLVYYHNPQIPPHYKESGFIYEKMAFGEICTEHDEIVDVLCEYMENNCALKDFYRERQDDFFAYSDNNSCRRIYEIVKDYEDNK